MAGNKDKFASLALRLGLAFVFIYAAISSWLNPFAWIGFFPLWLRDLLPSEVLLNGFSVYEAVLGLWLVLGWKLRLSSALAAVSLAGVIAFNLGALDIIFRDVGLAAAALALFFLSVKNN